MEELDIKELLYAMFKKKIFIILAVVIGAILGLLYTKFLVTPMYSSYSTLVLSRATDSLELDNIYSQNYTGLVQGDTVITQNDITINSKLNSAYRGIVKSRTVSSQVKEELNLDISEDKLISMISLTTDDDSGLIKIVVKGEDPKLITEVANVLSDIFIVKVKEIYNLQNFTIIDRAYENDKPYNVNYAKNSALGAVIGAIISCGVIFIAFYFDTKIRTKEEVEELLGLEIIGIIPDMDN